MRHKFFLTGLLIVVLLTLAATHLLPSRALSLRENRPLHQFPSGTGADFIAGRFQEQWEKALADQLFLADSYKQLYNGYKQLGLGLTTGLLTAFIKEKPEQISGFEATYLPRGENVFEIKESGNLFLFVYEPDRLLPIFREKLWQFKKAAGRSNQAEYYLYYIESNRDIDFKHKQFPHVYQKLLQTEFAEIGLSAFFKIDSLKDFTQQFYRTDHHWNHVGQAKAYQQVISLLLGPEEPLYSLYPHQTAGIQFVGSRARQIDDFSKGDDFYINLAEIPPYHVYVNEQESEHGHLSAYAADQVADNIEISHYAECFGPDKGLIEYDFMAVDKPNLLVLADSYSNAVNHLLAAHFNHSYFVDLRHYHKDTGKKFELNHFIDSHQIDKVLIMGSAGMIIADEFAFEVE
ncbi:hypothetical protein EII17_01460 [Clostridiales bacterium COT073_COT-073]|nr:hypothetical protein EII17_01460 [Clostridiales bacterium COT073_COT-073]